MLVLKNSKVHENKNCKANVSELIVVKGSQEFPRSLLDFSKYFFSENIWKYGIICITFTVYWFCSTLKQ